MFTVNRKALADALSLVQTCVETKGTIPVLAFALFEMREKKLSVRATDLDVTLQTSVEAEGDNADVCIPAKQLAQLVSLFEGDTVSLTPNNDTERVKISCGKSKYTLPTTKVENYPNAESVTGKQFLTTGAMLKMLFERTVFCVSTDESRFNMAGVYLEVKGGNLSCVATDGFRLAVMKCGVSFSGEITALVPRKAALAIMKAIDDDELVSIVIDEKGAKFTQGDLVIHTRLLMGQFPKYEMIVPKEHEHSFVISDSARSAIKRAALTARYGTVNGSTEVFLDVSKTSISLVSSDSDKGDAAESIEGECPTLNGEVVRLGVATKQILDILSVEPELTFGFDNNKKSYSLTPTGLREYDYKYVLAPVAV